MKEVKTKKNEMSTLFACGLAYQIYLPLTFIEWGIREWSEMENVVRFSFILRLHYYIGFLFFMKI
jgi:hypothetical protein